MKSLKQVCEKLKPEYQGIIDAYRFQGEECEDTLSYERFERIMMENGWILSDKTVITKWKILKTNGIIRMVGPGKALISGKGLAKALEYACYVEEKNKKNIFSEASEEVDA